MFREKVDSTCLKSIGYEGDILEVEFHGGNVYQYMSVPKSMYSDLISADSIGQFYRNKIRDNKNYKYKKII